jgi:hypothetical protein
MNNNLVRECQRQTERAIREVNTIVLPGFRQKLDYVYATALSIGTQWSSNCHTVMAALRMHMRCNVRYNCNDYKCNGCHDG